MNKRILPVFLIVFFFTAQAVKAQVPATTTRPDSSLQLLPKYKVAIFAPLYLDSAFIGKSYRYGKGFPRFTLQGFEFVQGVQMALDSMPVYGANVSASIFDAKSYTQPVQTLIANKQLDSFNLIIGNVRDAEYLQLAGFAQQKHIPFISATYPNDGGISANPFVAIINSTLKAHCEAIYSYILQNHGSSNILLVRKPGSQEDKVASYFHNINTPDGKGLLSIKTVNIESDSFAVLKPLLDSGRRTIIIGASLNEGFAGKLASYCAELNGLYPTTLFGMPNWDAFSFMNKKNGPKDYNIYFTIPYYNSRTDGKSRMIKELYRARFRGNPSDMVYKGYETAQVFTGLLAKYPNDLMNHLNDYSYKIFTDYNFKPVFLSKDSKVPDYFENKKLYFMKSNNGFISRAW
ncbi:MAG: ABC transporter substrate-binding protein [Ferruginibacter sp.]